VAMRKKTHDEFCNEVFQIVRDEYLVLGRYESAKTPLKMRHVCGYEWAISPTNFLSGKRCPKCAGVAKYTIEGARRIFKKHNYTLLDNIYQNANAPMKFICDIHKEKGTQSASLSSVNNANGGCRYCTNEKISKAQLNNTSIEDVRKAFFNRGLLLLDDEYKGRNVAYSCACLKNPRHPHGKVRLGNILYSEQGGCIECGKEKMQVAKRTPANKIKNTVEDLGLQYIGVHYRGRNNGGTVVCFTCPKHPDAGVLQKKLDKFRAGQGCPLCSQSRGERRIECFLNHRQICYIPQKKYDNLRGLGGGLLSYDFYLPEFSMLVEFQGIQHAEYTAVFHKAQNDFLKQLEHDRLKRVFAKENNLQLVEIWHHQFDDIEIILSGAMWGGRYSA
jgi:hypothetical protein